MVNVRSFSLAAALLVSSAAFAQPFAFIGPVGFVEGFETPGDSLPDSVFGPPGAVLREPVTILGRADAVSFVEFGPGNTVLRVLSPIATDPQDIAGLSENGAANIGTKPSMSSKGSDFIEWFQVYSYWVEAFFPAPGDPARVSADLLLTDASESYLFTSRDPSVAQLGGVVYFGTLPGQDSGAPGAPDPTSMRYLATNGYPLMGVCADENGQPIPGCVAPQGYEIGQPLLTPVGSWFSMTIEDLADIRQRVYVDFNDGAGEILAGEMETIDITYAANRLIVGSTLAVPSATLYVDNLTATGYVNTRYPDTNGDRIIDFTDLNTILDNFGVVAGAGYPFGDVNNDQRVNFDDLNAVLSAFGQKLD